MSLKKQQGFTIVELLIVIVVIGILAALVITTFTGIQQKSRNTERTTDIKSLHQSLESYFAQENKYPTLAQFNDSSWRDLNNFKGLDADAFKDPQGTAQAVVATPAAGSYAYVTSPAGCDNAGTADCTSYVLTATLEGAAAHVKNSLN